MTDNRTTEEVKNLLDAFLGDWSRVAFRSYENGRKLTDEEKKDATQRVIDVYARKIVKVVE